MDTLLPTVVGVAARVVGALDRFSLFVSPDAHRAAHEADVAERTARLLHRRDADAAPTPPLPRLVRVRRVGPESVLLFVNEGGPAHDLVLEAGGALHALGQLGAGRSALARIPARAQAVRLHYRDAAGRAVAETVPLAA